MKLAHLIFSLILPLIIWLLYGSPDLTLTGNLTIFLVVILHLYAIIWVGLLFSWFNGDKFTYSMATMSINGVSFTATFVAGLLVLLMFDRKIDNLQMISPFAWAVICIGLLLTITIPLITSRHVPPLPKSSERREFENPCDSNS